MEKDNTRMKLTLKYFLVVLFLHMLVECEGTSQGCHCDSLIITDKYGKVTGNCQSHYNGVPWCYLQKGGSSGCTDREASTVLRGRLWSHTACGVNIEPEPQYHFSQNDLENSGCQCDSLTTTDKYGRVNGNCQSHHQGHPWCFLPESGLSSCTDVKSSETVGGRLWSHQACALDNWGASQLQTQHGHFGCQCDSLTVPDKHGNLRGDCRSFYKGSPWCFLPENGFSSCSDARASITVRGRQWSYEACGNPTGGSPQFGDEQLLIPIDSLVGRPVELFDPSGQVVVEVVDLNTGQSLQVDPPIELFDPSGQTVVEVVDLQSDGPSPLVDSTIQLFDPSGERVVEVVDVSHGPR